MDSDETNNNNNNKNEPDSNQKEGNELMSQEEENEYKAKIAQLQQELEKEREKAKMSDQNIIEDLKKEISLKDKEIKKYAIINTKQRDELEKLSKEMDDRLSKMNYTAISKQLRIENIKSNELKFKKYLTEQEICGNKIAIKEKQLKNLNSLIEILEKENTKLKQKIEVSKNDGKKFKLLDEQREQEKQLIQLTNEIKQKKIELKEHSKCAEVY